MAFELLAEGFADDWVDGLAPVELRHYYDELIRNRAARQREQLHIQVSAAAVIADGGKLAKMQDSALSDAAGRPSLRDEPPAGSEKKTLDDEAKVRRSFEETADLWKK